MYIDDGICAASTLEEAEEHSTAIQVNLGEAGFSLNQSKSKLKPHQSGNWIGFTIDLALGYFHIPDKKIERLKASAVGITDPSRVPIRAIAGVIGHIMSMSLAMGPIALLRTKMLYAVINSYFSWNVWVTLTEDAKEELCFWQSNVAALNGQPIWFKSGATRVVFFDASDSGYGGYSVEVVPGVMGRA